MRRQTLNAKAVKAFGRRRKLTAEVRKLRQQLKLLENRVELAEDDLFLARETTRVVKGMALNVDGANVRAIDEEMSPRWTSSYTNVHDGGIGLYFRQWRPTGGYEDVATITSQPEATARRRALAWVVRGELPKKDKDLIVHHVYGKKERAHR